MIQNELARAVVRGYLLPAIAEAALVAIAARNTRTGIDKRDLADAIRFDRHVFEHALDRAETAADTAQAAIVRATRWLAARRAPSRVILDEAHNANKAHGFPLTERQVNAIAADALRRHMRGAA